jgi:isoleucyl-tRNA synthetase
MAIFTGYRVQYSPGWDCHGLPIELKALAAAGTSASTLSPSEIRQKAQELASAVTAQQTEGFKSYGVMADWDRWWCTMRPDFEVAQLRLFQRMVAKGLIYRKHKPVYWSPSSRTALAEAELEYKDDHVSHAAYVRFAIRGDWRAKLGLGEDVLPENGRLFAVVWTTTPWSLPANRAIAMHDELEYCIVRHGQDGLLVAKSRLESAAEWLKSEVEIVVPSIPGVTLRQLGYHNPLREGEGGEPASSQIIHASHVSAESGTGLVHIAPAHGMEDYEACADLDVDMTAPITDWGHFTTDAYPRDPSLLASKSLLHDGGRAVLDIFGTDVVHTHKHVHKYPYDWRTKEPVIIRATAQWFADVQGIKDKALKALENVRFIPRSGRARLESFIKGRSEWCISRQRSWGVPIPALFDEHGNAVLSDESIDHIITTIKERGTDAWFADPLDDPAWVAPSLSGTYRRGTDTMDVWFDSGSSWSRTTGQADVYLEGSDQHRGWFQSSLLTYIAAQDADETPTAPFKTLITHGFTLDAAGKKMSKSLGNVVSPTELMEGTLLPPLTSHRQRRAAGEPPCVKPNQHDGLGADALRLWVASCEYTRDVNVGLPALKAIQSTLLKYRTTMKMLLGSMHESARTAPLTTLDHIALIHLKDVMAEVGAAYEKYEFYKAFAAINHWVTGQLSGFYLDSLKDRLYCGDGGGVLEPLFFGFGRMLAPITPMLVEEAWDNLPEWMKADK